MGTARGKRVGHPPGREGEMRRSTPKPTHAQERQRQGDRGRGLYSGQRLEV